MEGVTHTHTHTNLLEEKNLLSAAREDGAPAVSPGGHIEIPSPEALPSA